MRREGEFATSKKWRHPVVAGNKFVPCTQKEKGSQPKNIGRAYD